MGRLILLRHGQSVYNKQNIFTGWTDVELSDEGIAEAKRAGQILKSNALLPDLCFTSWLKRAIHTAQLALREMDWEQIDCVKSWKLNERHYGAWQQRNKDEVKAEVGEEAFVAVRRGYATPPPPLPDGDPRLPDKDPKFRLIDPQELPRSESLKDTRQRTLNYFYEAIAPELARDKTVLVSAHGNSLRALTMAIENLSPEAIVKVEIPTGIPILYRFDETLLMQEKKVLA
ncbi:2,3-diphosphoglycerate-dependent phosphoglycerate mutase [Nitratifractor sp.]|uniref:2,3-bisphosphoglycerate-dependent phosphoglycerate mutase n=1 Tax=Nitratifractor sp. TaxID=2268144 RepID=UPI0025F93369|nr:2,3-diphosphoglycerate-dependent phosphoglycerate mutase [Nitratifractor sp.]